MVKEIKLAFNSNVVLDKNAVSAIKIPQNAQVRVQTLAGDVLLPPVLNYPVKKNVVIEVKNGSLKIVSLDGTRLVIVDEGKEVVFE